MVRGPGGGENVSRGYSRDGSNAVARGRGRERFPTVEIDGLGRVCGGVLNMRRGHVLKD